VGVYLGGYYTSVDSQLYDVTDAADELFAALKRDRVLDRQNILFVCHSTGGIVVRYMLYHHREEFYSSGGIDKTVGMLLIASPSYGSKIADIDVIRYLTDQFNNRLSGQLRWNNEFLKQLDGNFKDLVHFKLVPHLVGREAVENHFVVHRKWLPLFDRHLVVEPESAGRYFAHQVRLRDTDHFSAVKPDSREHPAYELLADFFRDEFRGMEIERAQDKLLQLKSQLMQLYGLYEASGTYGTQSEAARQVTLNAEPLGKEILRIDDDSLGAGFVIAKYEYVCFANVLAASLERRPDPARSLAEDALDAASRALARRKDILRAAEQGDLKARQIEAWLNAGEEANRLRFLMAVAHAIRARTGIEGARRDVLETLQEIDPSYLQRFPAAVHPDVGRVLRQMSGRR